MLWAAVCTCYFFIFLGSGEVVVPSDSDYDSSTHLSFGDVRVDSVDFPQYVEVRIKASKTDPFRQGVSVFLGWTDADLCPLATSTAALCGVQDSLIKSLGGWESSAYMLYIHTPREALCAVSCSLERGVV